MRVTKSQLEKMIIYEAEEAKGLKVLQQIADPNASVSKKGAEFLQKLPPTKKFNLKSLKGGIKIFKVIYNLFKELKDTDDGRDAKMRAASVALQLPVERLLALISFGNVPLNLLFGKVRKKMEAIIRSARGQLWLMINKPALYKIFAAAAQKKNEGNIKQLSRDSLRKLILQETIRLRLA